MRIEELTLYSDKIDELKTFYKNLFDIKLFGNHKEHFSFQIGWSKLTFSSAKPPAIYHYCFLIPSDKMAQTIEWIDKKVQLIETQGRVIHRHTHWNAEAIYFFDPAGNIVELIARHNMNHKSRTEFTSQDILCLNEIGLPSNDCDALNSTITELTGSTVWKGSPNRFIINGNEEGMFLLINNTIKIKWYPTEIFPESVSIKAKIRIGNRRFKISYDKEEFKVDL